MKKNLKTFFILLDAFGISMAYQYYRYTLHEHPADTFGATEVIGYGVFMGWSCLALVYRRWAARVILALCVLQLFTGFLYYLPYVFSTRHGRFWDWAELIGFVLLIIWAGWRAVARLAILRSPRSGVEAMHPAR